MSQGADVIEGSVEESTLGLENTNITEDISNESENDEGSDRESVRETVERVYKEAQKEETKNEVGQKPEAKPQKQANGLKQEEALQIEDIKPPQRLTAEEKEIFLKSPPALKKAISKMLLNHEGLLTKKNQELAAATNESRHLVEAVRPYLLNNPHLMEMGYTESRIVSELIATHQKLTKPETSVDTWLKIGQQIGLSPETISAISETVGGKTDSQNFDIETHPKFKALQDKINSLESYYGQQVSQSQQSAQLQAVTEMEAVRDEMDASGRYVYPELHDEAFILRVKPLVSAIVETSPDVSYGEALKRATLTMRGNFQQSVQTKIPAQTNNNDINKRAAQAAVSVRGKVPPMMSQGEVGDIPKEALGSARDSVRWALAQLRKG